MWWHLGVIDNPQAQDSVNSPPPRLFWHWTWYLLLQWLGMDDFFDRALLIHRTQFLVAFLAITASAYLILASILNSSERVSSQILSFSIVSAVIWCFMTGTRSVAKGGGWGSDVTQSWILWYSLTYQISLVFTLLATSSTLYAVTTGSHRGRLLAILLAIVCLVVAFVFHMAEIAYYLLSLALLAVFFVRRRSSVVLLAAIMILGVLFAALVIRYSYAKPAVLDLLSSMSLDQILTTAADQGQHLRKFRATRVDTGWTILHLASAAALFLVIFLSWLNGRMGGEPAMKLRPALFVLSTAVFPLALFSDLGAGLYALIAYKGIAYRFSFASLLFVGIPLCALVLGKISMRGRPATGQAITSLAFSLAIVGGALAVDKAMSNRPAAFRFADSVVRSVSPRNVYFGMSDADNVALRQLGEAARNRDQSWILCPGIFSSYYLLFVERYKNVDNPLVPLFSSPNERGQTSGFCSSYDYFNNLYRRTVARLR